MTVDNFAEVLRDPNLMIDEESYYISHTTRRPGWRAIVTLGGSWYWYSVSSAADRVSAQEVADAITASDRRISRSGSYKCGAGFEATIRSGAHWFMLGHGNNRPRVEDIG
jgi:hypothetical protein